MKIKILALWIFLAFSIFCFSACASLKTMICKHSETAWVVDESATLDSEGIQHLECTICGTTLQTETIPELYLSSDEVSSMLGASVVKVICYDYDKTTEISQGSGFFIDNNGTFITNAHVVEDCFYIKIKTHSGAIYDVDVICKYNDITSDYAICRAKNCYSTAAVEFSSSCAVGDTVYALGYPNDAYHLRTTSGTITSTNAIEDAKHYYSNTAWIDHGSSGGILADAKGRVLGITTGEFTDGEYAALPYPNFKADVESGHFNTQSPLEYFHTVDEIWLASYNFDDYFDIFVESTSTSDTRVSYSVTVRLKEKFWDAKLIIDSINISVTIQLDTEYKYKEVTDYGTWNRSDSDWDYLYFKFWDTDDLLQGDTQYTFSSIYIPYSTEYYGMNIAYSADFFGGNGTIIIYDLYG